MANEVLLGLVIVWLIDFFCSIKEEPRRERLGEYY